jgi:hypothetical protein
MMNLVSNYNKRNSKLNHVQKRNTTRPIRNYLGIILILTSLFTILFPAHLLNTSNKYNSSLPLVAEPNYLKTTASLGNFSSDSLEVVAGNVRYNDLLQNPHFNVSSDWTFTSSSNISSQWSPDGENAWLSHYSNETAQLKRNETAHATELILIVCQTSGGSVSDTHLLDGTNLDMLEGGSPGSYLLNAEFLFNSTLTNATLFQVNFFGSVQDASDPFPIEIFNFIDAQWEPLYQINSVTATWFNGTKLQAQNEYRYINQTGSIILRVYDADASDTKRERIYIDYLEVILSGVSQLKKEFTQSASCSQSFAKGFSTEMALSGHVLLNFSYQIEELVNVDLLELRVQLWDSTQFLGIIWSSTASGPTALTTNSVDIGDKVSAADVYNISFKVYAEVATPLEVNFSIRYDDIYITCQNDSGLHDLTHYKDSASLELVPLDQGLDVRFQFTIPEGNLSFSMFYEASLLFTIWVYNFTSTSWDNFTNLLSPTYTWTNRSNIRNFDYVNDGDNRFILRFTNGSALSNSPLILDYQTIQITQYSSELTHLQTSPAIVAPGETTITQVNFSSAILGMAIEGATMLTNWTEDQCIPLELGDGLYNLTFYTDLATPGTKRIEIIAMREGFENASVSTSFILSGAPSELRFISGVTLINGSYWATPLPYSNDQTKEVQIYLNSSAGEPLDGATIQARLNITNNLMPYEDLGYSVGHLYDGFYNITIDTAGLHEGQIGRINIRASAEGFLVALLNFTFQVIELPSHCLALETDVENFTIYEGESLRIGASFYNSFHDKVLFTNPSDGNLTWRIDSPDANDSHLMEHVLLVYIADISLPFYNVTAGNYNLTIETWASRDFANLKKDIRLVVLPKQTVSLNFISLPSSSRVGQRISIKVQLRNTTSHAPMIETLVRTRIFFLDATNESLIGTEINKNSLTDADGIIEENLTIPECTAYLNITISFAGTPILAAASNNSLLEVLPKTSVVLELINITSEILSSEPLVIKARLSCVENSSETISGATIRFLLGTDEKVALTNQDGIAEITFNLPSGKHSLSLEVYYDGAASIVAANTTATIQSITVWTLVMRYSPFWLGAIIGAIAAVTAYHLAVRLPRRKLLHAKYKRANSFYTDLFNLKYLMVLDKDSGVPIYQFSFGQRTFDPSLIGGFLTAIMTFQAELIRDQKKVVEEDWLIGYKGSKIFVHNSTFIRIAFILDDTPSEQLKINLHNFAIFFEKKYSKNLVHKEKAPKIYREASYIVEDAFEISLTNPHKIKDLTKHEIKALSEQEREIVLIASLLQEESGYFHLSRLLSKAQAVRKEPQMILFGTIYVLREKNILNPIFVEEAEAIDKQRKLSSEKSEVTLESEATQTSVKKENSS